MGWGAGGCCGLQADGTGVGVTAVVCCHAVTFDEQALVAAAVLLQLLVVGGWWTAGTCSECLGVGLGDIVADRTTTVAQQVVPTAQNKHAVRACIAPVQEVVTTALCCNYG